MKTSNSAIQTFKACRRLYELKYIHGLEPVQTAAPLSRGTSYHEGVEHVLKDWAENDCVPFSGLEIDDPKIRAMVYAFSKTVVPWLSDRGIRIGAVEQWFEYSTKSGHKIIGRVDGITTDHSVIEHKSTSGAIDGSYFQRLEFDEQIPTYMLACNTDRVYYTVCSAPTIRQRKGEPETAYFERCVEWYNDMPESKIAVVELYRPQEVLNKFADDQDAIITDMEG